MQPQARALQWKITLHKISYPLHKTARLRFSKLPSPIKINGNWTCISLSSFESLSSNLHLCRGQTLRAHTGRNHGRGNLYSICSQTKQTGEGRDIHGVLSTHLAHRSPGTSEKEHFVAERSFLMISAERCTSVGTVYPSLAPLQVASRTEL